MTLSGARMARRARCVAARRLRGALRAAQEAFYASLDPLSVADLIEAPTGPLLLSLTSAPTTSPTG